MQYGPMVLRRCQKLLKNEAIAHDAMQDVFVNVLSNKKKLDLSKPSSLLYRIATNICLNKLRSVKRQKLCISDEQDDLLMDIASLEDIEKQTIFTKILDELFKTQHESTKVIAVMHYIDGFTLAEVSLEVNLSVSGVRKRLKKLNEQLKKIEGIEI